MNLALPTLWAFGLVLMRTAGLAIAMPSWGGRQIPMRVRMALVFSLAFAVYQGAGAPQANVPEAFGALAAASLIETLTGLLGGIGARIALEAATAAGAMISTATGLSYGALVDPQNGAESNALATMLRLFALAAAIELGLHREAVLWLIESLRDMPVGQSTDLMPALARGIAQAGTCAALAVRIAFPVLALVGCGYLALGAVGRVVPQLGLQNLGFSVSVLLGAAAVYAIAPEAARRLGAITAQAVGG